MKFIGIDLGTTNSVICAYDGESIRLYKSPDQNDVTPSAIFIDKRGNKYLGKRAYDSAAKNPDNAATKFKRMMGTSTPVKLAAANIVMTPEECSAEILKLCFGYLPEDIRNSGETGTVITVPAAFNQMQKDATMSAAKMAGLGNVALMQEPVAAVMSVMRQRKNDGIFLVYDLGGGTLDIAIAESTSGRVNLLAHGGIAMCGGTDFDRAILDNVVKPWLMSNFSLPDDVSANPKYKSLLRMCLWAAEKAKIELTSREDAAIILTESDLGMTDESGEEIYVDIPLNREQLDILIADRIDDSIRFARETLEKAGLSSQDIECVVFVGGPTQYKPLQNRVSFELGIAVSTDVNPMTAVAEGAAVFAESIDWASQNHGRKSSRGAISTGGDLALSFNYIARTPGTKAKVVANLGGNVLPAFAFQIDSLDNGWSSGRMALRDGVALELSLAKPGENLFKVFVFDANGGLTALANDKITITRTAASVDAIPASHSIGIEARDKLGGSLVLQYLVREGEQLPKKGKIGFRTEDSLKAGSPGSIRFKLWEGDITHQIDDNLFIGMFEIKGTDFEQGVIPAGAELICEYEISDSGNAVLDVSVRSIGGSFRSGHNFYTSRAALTDYSKAAKLIEEQSDLVLRRLDEIASKIHDPRLDQARAKLHHMDTLGTAEPDVENAKQAMDNVQTAKRLLAMVRREHLKEMRQIELDKAVNFFNDLVREHARPLEVSAFDNLVKTATRSMENASGNFEVLLDELYGKSFVILWRQDWFVIDRFKRLSQSAHLFTDAQEHEQYVAAGMEALKANDIEKLRSVVLSLDANRLKTAGVDELMADANIVRYEL